MSTIPIILDTDPGIDDAVAIAAALFAPQLDLKLLTTVAGNVSVEKTTRNALQLMHFWHKNIPVAQGAATPLVRKLRDAAYVHGESGMEGYEFVEHQRAALDKPAFQAIYECLNVSLEPITRAFDQYCAAAHSIPAMQGEDQTSGDHGRIGRARQLHTKRRV